MNTRHHRRIQRTARTAVLSLLTWCAVFFHAPASAQAPDVTLAWDPIADAGVAGYMVYVGTISGSYAEQYDAGNRTMFVYSRATAGQPYYFTVAAYTSDRVMGPRSAEIVFIDGIATLMGPVSSATAPDGPQPAGSTSSAVPRVLCRDSANCHAVEKLAELRGSVTDLTPTDDGRLFFIHDRRHVRVIAGNVLMSDSALTADPGVEVTGLALDPAFEGTRHVYVGEVDTRVDRSRTLTVKRYREVAGTLAEGAAIVAGLPLPEIGDAPFTIDARGRIYVAVPSAVDSGRGGSPYEGMVIGFERDGTVSHGSRAGSPIIARGYDRPDALAWISATDALWLSGETVGAGAGLSQLSLQGQSSEWPRTPASAYIDADLPVVSLSTARQPLVVAIDDAGSLLRIDPVARTVVDTLTLTDLGRGAATAAALDGSGIYVALADSDVATSLIVRLRRQ